MSPDERAKLVLELPAIVELFASDFEDLPEIVTGVPTARRVHQLAFEY